MAFEAMLPRPQITWDTFFRFPVATANGQVVGSQTVNGTFYQLAGPWYQNGANPVDVAGFSAAGVATTKFLATLSGKLGVRYASAGNFNAQQLNFYWWQPPWSSADINAGTLFNSAGDIVAVIDLVLAFTGTPGGNDGVFFLPYDGNSKAESFLPDKATPQGGFGIRGNGLGDANVEAWEAGTGSVLSAAASGVADISDLFTCRFLVKPATSGGNAQLQAFVNGALRYSQTFGAASSALELPTVGVANAYNFCPVFAYNSAGSMFVNLSARWGRYLPDGTEFQAQ